MDRRPQLTPTNPDTMTTRTALATLADLIDPDEPIDFPALRQDIDRARREFTEEELPADLHRARLAAAQVLETATRYTTEQTATGTRYNFGDGTTLETNATDGTGRLTRRGPDGQHAIGLPIRNTGDAYHALRTGRPIPDHCKAY